MSKAAELAALIGSQTALSDRNILINGGMTVAQRGTSTSMAHDGTTDAFGVDRFRISMGGTHEQLDGTFAQVTDHPLSVSGKSSKWTTGTAESSYDSDEYFYFAQLIEAQNVQHLQYGGSNAQSVTLSFYVKSSVTGTFACNLYKPDNTLRIINKTYAISSANTWEKKTITFPADTGGGGINNDNGQGLYAVWHLAAGSGSVGGGSNGAWKTYGGLTDWADGQATNAVATTAGATWQVTDCQLEVGEQATPFEHRSVHDELARCQRYYFESQPTTSYAMQGIGAVFDGDSSDIVVYFPTTMRTKPTFTFSNLAIFVGTSGQAVTAAGDAGSTTNASFIRTTYSSAFTVGQAAVLVNNNNVDGYARFDAEL
jgi:hypothetical protein